MDCRLFKDDTSSVTVTWHQIMTGWLCSVKLKGLGRKQSKSISRYYLRIHVEGLRKMKKKKKKTLPG